MLRKLFALMLVLTLSGIAVFAQQNDEENRDRAETFNLYFSGGGSYLGVQTRNVSKENMAQFGLDKVQGVAIEKVLDNSPAAQAGLMKGDVIISFNGEKVTSVRKLSRLIREVAPDHSTRIEVLRNGVKQEFDVTMGKREMPRFRSGNFSIEMPNIPPIPDIEIPEMPDIKVFPRGESGLYVLGMGSSRRIGVSVSPLTKQLGEYFGVSEGKGLLVKNVRKDSPADKAGLKAGDVIVEVEGKEVKRTFDLIRQINEKKEGDVTITIIRNQSRQTITVTPEKASGGVLRFEENMENVFEQESGRVRFRGKAPKGVLAKPVARPAVVRNGSRIL